VITRILRRLRWQTRRWSTDTDREFHDQAFAGGPADPFTFAYPGYVTIRRFADLAAERVAGASRVVDVGCGPGEITCELASRFPTCRFEGFDHSAVAIDRARAHAARLGLANASFTARDASVAAATGRADLVLMFDSFHHLLDPAEFVRQMGAVSDRFLLLEPAGTRLGGWRRTIDADWIASDLDSVRARAEHLVGYPRLPLSAPAAPTPHAGEAVEHRYALEDFARFFAGFGLEVRGTVAGFDVYPPAAEQVTPLRERVGRYAYELVTQIDEDLRRLDRDLLAKHWVVYAERGREGTLRRVPDPPDAADGGGTVRGAFDVRYVALEVPPVVEKGTIVHAQLTVENQSWRPWSTDVAAPVRASYHWWRPDRVELERDGLRSPLPHVVEPGEQATIAFRVRAPELPGRYLLAVDMVEEGLAWFSDAGVPCLVVAVTVRDRA